MTQKFFLTQKIFLTHKSFLTPPIFLTQIIFQPNKFLQPKKIFQAKIFILNQKIQFSIGLVLVPLSLAQLSPSLFILFGDILAEILVKYYRDIILSQIFFA